MFLSTCSSPSPLPSIGSSVSVKTLGTNGNGDTVITSSVVDDVVGGAVAGVSVTMEEFWLKKQLLIMVRIFFPDWKKIVDLEMHNFNDKRELEIFVYIQVNPISSVYEEKQKQFRIKVLHNSKHCNSKLSGTW